MKMKPLSALVFIFLVYITYVSSENVGNMLDRFLDTIDTDYAVADQAIKMPWAGKDASKKRILLTKIKTLLEDSIENEEKTNEKEIEIISISDLLENPVNDETGFKVKHNNEPEVTNTKRQLKGPWAGGDSISKKQESLEKPKTLFEDSIQDEEKANEKEEEPAINDLLNQVDNKKNLKLKKHYKNEIRNTKNRIEAPWMGGDSPTATQHLLAKIKDLLEDSIQNEEENQQTKEEIIPLSDLMENKLIHDEEKANINTNEIIPLSDLLENPVKDDKNSDSELNYSRDEKKPNTNRNEIITYNDLLENRLYNNYEERKTLPWKRNLSYNRNSKEKEKVALYRRVINDINDLFSIADE